MSAEFEAARVHHARMAEVSKHRVHDAHDQPLKRQRREFPMRSKKSAKERQETPHERTLSNFGHFVRMVREVSDLNLRSFAPNVQDTKTLFGMIARADQAYFHPPEVRTMLRKEYKLVASALGIPKGQIEAFGATTMSGEPRKDAIALADVPNLLKQKTDELQAGLNRSLAEASAALKRFVEHPATNDVLPVLEFLSTEKFTFSDTTDTAKDSKRPEVSLQNVAAAAVQLMALREPLKVLTEADTAVTDQSINGRFSRALPLVKQARAEFQIILDELSSKRLSGLRREAQEKYQAAMHVHKNLPRAEKSAKRSEHKATRDARVAEIAKLRKIRAQVEVARKQLTPVLQAVRAGNRARFGALPKLDRAAKHLATAQELAPIAGKVAETLAAQVEHLQKMNTTSPDALAGVAYGNRQKIQKEHLARLRLLERITGDWETLAKEVGGGR
ncbi:MAG: hypothetical protein KBD05_03615 [Candidatus Pacebacteria bacterium]|nr:hypothetical protein [Candidatus Paceibacterota bacterium]